MGSLKVELVDFFRSPRNSSTLHYHDKGILFHCNRYTMELTVFLRCGMVPTIYLLEPKSFLKSEFSYLPRFEVTVPCLIIAGDSFLQGLVSGGTVFLTGLFSTLCPLPLISEYSD